MATLEAEWRRREADQASAAEVSLSAAAAVEADARKVNCGDFKHYSLLHHV